MAAGDADLELGNALVSRHVAAEHRDRLDLVLVADRGAVELLGELRAMREQKLRLLALERLDDAGARDLAEARGDPIARPGRRELGENAVLDHFLHDRARRR